MNISDMEIYKKIFTIYSQGRLGSAVYSRIRPFLKGLKYILRDPAAGLIKLHRPSYLLPEKKDKGLAERIFTAYKKMKTDQAKAKDVYQASSLWEGQLKRSYDYLVKGLEDNDVDKYQIRIIHVIHRQTK